MNVRGVRRDINVDVKDEDVKEGFKKLEHLNWGCHAANIIYPSEDFLFLDYDNHKHK